MSSFLRLTLSGALLLALMLDCAVSLRCVPCGGKDRCQEEPQVCLYGLVLDVCECCMVCGKGEGEVCGGLWNMRGKCGDGLVCVKPQSYPEQASYPEGKCRSHPTKRPLIHEDDDEYGNATTTAAPSTTSTMAPNDISDLDLIRSLTYSQWIRRRLRN